LKTNYIKGRYYEQEGVWQLLHPKYFDNALLISRLEGRGEKEISNVAALIREGLASCTGHSPPPGDAETESDSLVRSHNIADAFKPFEKRDGTTVTPEVIVISGAPGMGKTTICKEIAYQWAKGQFLHNSCLVFYVYLRDPEAQKICDLQSFVHYFYNFDMASTEFSKRCADAFIERNKNIALILIGYDEHFDVSGNLFLTDIINRKISCFAESKLVITCGPIVTAKLQHVADVKVDLLGFTDKSKKAYVQKELQNSPDKIEKLSLFLSRNREISNICNVPVIMSILVYTFKEIDELPANRIELYERFIALSMLQYLKMVDNEHKCKILDLQSLPECFQECIAELSKLAFNLKHNNSVFTAEELDSVCPNIAAVNNKFPELILLKSALYFNMKRTETCYSYKFLYSSIQEFLATYYVNSINPSVQFDLLKRTFFAKKHADTVLLLANSKKNLMFKFFEYSIYGNPCEELKIEALPQIADLDPLQAFFQLAKICTNHSTLTNCKLLCYKNSEVDLYKKDSLSNTLEKISLLNRLSTMKFDWNKVYMSLCSSRHRDGHSLEAFVIDKSKQEAAYVKLASQLNDDTRLAVVIVNAVSMVAYRATKQQLVDGFDINDSISNVTMRQCIVDDETANKRSQYFSKTHTTIAAFCGCSFEGVGHRIIFNGLSTINSLQILMFDNTNIDETAAIALSSVITKNTKLFLLEVFKCNLCKNSSVILAALKNISTVLTLSLSDNKIPGSVADDLAVVFYTNRNLERLRLANNNLKHQGAIIASALSQIKTLVELNLDNNHMTEKVADELALVIESNKSLQILRIGGNDLKNDGIFKIAHSISCLSKLRILEIDDNEITEDAADAIAVAISCNIQLEVLILNNNLLKKGVAKIANALLTGNITLQTLGISSNQIPEEVADALAAAIRSNCLLEVLNLSSNNLCDGGIITIAQSLASLSSLRSLYIGDNKITCKAADAIASVILANKKLETLYLNNNYLETGFTVIARALTQISCIKNVNFSRNRIPESGVDDLAAAFLSNKLELQSVSVAENNLKTTEIITISQALSSLSGLHTYSIFDNYGMGKACEVIAAVILNNTNLNSIHFSGNNLSTGVMKIGSAMNGLLLKELNFRYSNLSEKNASVLANAVLNQPLLEVFVLEGNNFDVSGIIIILKSLSNLNTIKLLNLDSTSITEEAADAVAQVILSNHRLEQLYLGCNKLCAGGIKVARALQASSNLSILDLNDNEMSADVADELGSALANFSSFEDLRLRNNNLTTSGVIKIAKSLSKLSTLRSLNIRKNHISARAADALSLLISNNLEMEELWLGINNLQAGILKILKSLEAVPMLRTLDIENNNLPMIAYDGLASFMRCNNCKLHTLYLERNDLRLPGAEIAQILHHCTSLRTVDLNGTNMTGEMADKLAIAIPNMTSLQQLWLKDNNLGTDKVIKIAQSLCTLTTIKQLSLIGNQITEDAADAIVSAINSNDRLEKLYLSDNDLRAGVLTIIRSLKNVPLLKVLYLDNNSIPDMVYEELATVLGKMHLETLDWSYNCLQLSGKCISQALCSIKTLTSLCLNNCFITNDCVDDLAAAIVNNIKLSSVYLKSNQLNTSGIVLICQSLKTISTLKLLSISSKIKVDGSAAEAIASVVTNNSKMNTLILNGCKLENKTVKIFKAFQVVSAVTVLHLGYMDMSDDVVSDLVLAINNNPLLKELNLCGNVLSYGLIKIAQVCKKSVKHLAAFDLQWNSVAPSAIADLAQVTGTITSLEVLLIGGSTLSFIDKHINNLALHLEKVYPNFSTLNINTLAKCKVIEILNYELQRSNIFTSIKINYDLNHLLFNYTDAVVNQKLLDLCLSLLRPNFQKVERSLLQIDSTTIVYLLPVISKLRVLDMEQSNIDEVAAFELAALLGSNGVLEQLWLGGNQLSTAGAIFILNSLVHLSTLKALDLSYNNIGCQSADSVAAVIQCNPMIQYLSLDGNDLLDSGVVTICQVLKSVAKLRILSLSSNGITDGASEAISFVMSSNNCLEDLSLNNKFKYGGIHKIVYSLKNLCRLRKLDLFCNGVTKDVADKISLVISNCYTLQELYLSDNMLETEGAVKIFKSLKHKSKLQVLTLNNNYITDEAIDELCIVLAQNPRLQVLLLGGNKLGDAIIKVAQVVQCENTIMHLLVLCENNVSKQGKQQVEILFSNNKLIHVYS